MLFSADAAAGIADGTITETYRRWKRPQAIAGHRYRTVGGFIVVDSVDVVEVSDVPAGVELRGDPALPITRVRFHLDESGHDPRQALADDADLDDDAVAAIDRRLARMDERAAYGPWTQATLALIASRPATRARDLAASLGRERDDWKKDVRRLKELGLTLSLPVGYRLSPRGEAYLRRTRVAADHVRPQPPA